MNCISVLPNISNKKVKFSMFSIIFAQKKHTHNCFDVYELVVQ